MFVKIVIFLLFAVLPNTYAFFGERLDIQYQKLALIYAVALLIIFASCLKIFLTKKITLPFSRIDLFIALFAISYTLSSLFSINPYTSIFGEIFASNKSGLLTLYSLLVIHYFLRFSTSFKDFLFAATITIGGIIYALAWGVFTHSAETFYKGVPIRMSATEFNVIYFTNYLMVGVPIILSLFFHSAKYYLKLFFFFIFILFIAFILFSLTRSAWIVTPVVCFVFFLTYFRSHPVSVSVKKVVPVTILLFSVLVYFLFPILSPRISAIWRDPIQNNSVSIRMHEQKSAIDIALKHPFLGTGPDTIRYVFPQYRPAQLNNEPRNWQKFTTYIRNYYLQLAATIGIPGALAFLSIIITASGQLYKTWKEEKNILYLGLSFAWFSLVLHFLMYDMTLTTAVFFWGFLGLLFSPLQPAMSEARHSRPTNYKLQSFFSSAIIILCIPLFFLSYALYRDVQSKYFFKRIPATPASIFELAAIEKAMSLNPIDPNYKIEYAYRLIEFSGREVNKENPDKDLIQTHLSKANQALLLADKIDPGDPYLKFFQARSAYLQFRLAKFKKTDRFQKFEKAITLALTAEKMAPTIPDFVDLVTSVYLENDAKSLKEAESQARKNIEIAPLFLQARHHLGEALKQQGRFGEAIAAYEESLKINPDDFIAKAEIEEIKALQTTTEP